MARPLALSSFVGGLSAPAAPAAPRTLQEASELRFKDVLDAARVFKHQQDTNSN